MSKEVNRNQVLQTTRVRTSLKNDASWIQISQQGHKEQDNARTDQAAETKPVLARQSSYVLSTAKKFEAVDSPLSPPLQNTHFIPSEGDSANQTNGEVIIPQKEAQPERSTVEATDDTKPHASTEELIQNGEAQPVSPTQENPEAASPVDPAEQSVASTTSENKEECADTAVDHSNIQQSEVNVSADTHVEDPAVETSGDADTEDSKDSAEVPAVFADNVSPQEEPSTETEPAIATILEDAGVELAVQPAEESSLRCPPEQAAEGVLDLLAKSVSESPTTETATEENCEKHPPEQAAITEVKVESSPETPPVTDAGGEEAVLQDSVEAVPDLLAKSVSESPTTAETTAEGSCDHLEQAAEETVEAVTEVKVESSPELPPGEEVSADGEQAGLHDSVEPVPDLVADTLPESPSQPAAETAVKSVECKVESTASAEPVLAEKVVECEVQPADNSVVEQSVEPTVESTADRVVELNIKDAIEPATAVQNKSANRTIELTDALDVEPPANEAAPEPPKDPEQSHTEETKLNQQFDHSNTAAVFQKPKEERQSTHTLNETRNTKGVCSLCDQIIEGNVRIIFSEPLVNCHPDCLKCGVCAKPLGDLLTSMFLHDQMIVCDGCFAKTLKT